MRAALILLAAPVFSIFLVAPASASFHLMQIERVIGGVNGGTNVQAIQLRMRAAFQNLVSQAHLYAHDATGGGNVELIHFPGNVANSAAGSRVLAATADFASATSPNLSPDFILTKKIPDAYLAAGSLTFEDDFGTVYWRLSWGGAAYTGPTTGAFSNDLDGQFGPPYPGPLPSTTTQSLNFKFAANAPSTNNANDYALSAGDATFINNAGRSGIINRLVGVGDPLASGLPALGAPVPNPIQTRMAYSVVLPRSARVQLRVLDVAGRVVRALADQPLPAGRSDLSWEAGARGPAALSDGVYFLEMNAEGVRRIQRFVVLN